MRKQVRSIHSKLFTENNWSCTAGSFMLQKATQSRNNPDF